MLVAIVTICLSDIVHSAKIFCDHCLPNDQFYLFEVKQCSDKNGGRVVFLY